jgi:hypothetical protein
MTKTSKKKEAKTPRSVWESHAKVLRQQELEEFANDSANDREDDGLDLEIKEREQAAKKRITSDASFAVMEAAFNAAVPRPLRRKLAHDQALAVIILVPTTAWVMPATAYFKFRFGPRWKIAAEEKPGSMTQKDGTGSGEVARYLSRGQSVAGISADVSRLPKALAAAADVTIRLQHPTGAVLREAIRRFTRRSAVELPDEKVVGLDFPEIVAAFRPGTGPVRIAQRLATSTALRAGDVSTDDIPDIAQAFEYGEARIWAMNLARDVADLRAGKLDWDSFPKGIVLHSEPGLGKSLFSKAVGNYCKVPVVVTSVADWFATDRSYLDEVVRNMRAAFTSAQSLAQGNGVAILFIDEIDAIPNRATLDGRNADYFRVFCNDILLRLDARRNVVVIGATNHVASIDPALLRPGRLERTVLIERPDYAGTLNILKFHVQSDLPEADLAEIAGMAERSTGAEIMHLVREGRRIARQAGRPLTAADLRSALLPLGDMPAAALRRVCLHEAGHATAVMATGCDRLRRITVRNDGDTMAHALIERNNDDLLTRRRIEDRVTILLAGRAAEHVLLDGVSEGAGGDSDGTGDLSRATSLVAMMNASFGMGSTITYLGDQRDAMSAVRTDPAFRARVERELKSLQKRADILIRKHRAAVVAIADALRERRYLSGETAQAIFKGHTVSSKATSLN